MNIKLDIRKKFLFPTLLLIILGMGTSALISYSKSKQALSQAILDNIEQRATSTLVVLENWLKDRQLDLNSWRNEEVYAKALNNTFIGKAARKSANEKFDRLQQDYGYFEDITLIDENGLVIASHTEKLIDKLNVKDREYFKQAMTGKTYVSDVAASRNTGNIVFFIAVPVEDKEQVKGVLLSVVSMESFSKLFIDPIKVGTSGHAYIFNKDGMVIAHPDKSQIMKMDLKAHEFGKTIMERKNGMIDYTENGEDFRAAFTTLEQTGWTVVVKAPSSEILSPISSLGRWNMAVAAVVIVIAAVFIYFITSTVSKPLKGVVANLRDAAEGEGDLTKRIPVTSSDEVGELAYWFNTFIEKIQNIIKEMAENAAELGNSSRELSEISAHLSKGADQTSDKALTVSSASEQMSKTVSLSAEVMEDTTNNLAIVAAGAEEMSSTIAEIANNTEKGRQIAEEAVGQTANATDQIQELGNAAQQIGKVVETITEISEQVNLLALNATIEAARAGEAGRGFAVVANEIKDLAKQTAAASGEIKQQIQGIQSSTKTTIDEIMGIAEVVNKVNELVSTIATAVEEQSVTTKDIAGNVARASEGVGRVNQSISDSSQAAVIIATDIADVTNAAGEISSSSAQVNDSSSALAGLADKLNAMVGQFKV